MSDPQQNRSGVRGLTERNPLLSEWERLHEAGDESARERVIAEYAFSVPTDEALEAIAEVSPRGVVEIGAGTGYWARLLTGVGVDVVAFDPDPPPSAANPWFAGVTPWFEVVAADHTVVSGHGERTLLLVCPTKNEEWAAECLQEFARVGGETVVFVGEGPGGRTGDDTFHALLGAYDRCLQCGLHIQSVPCICGIRPLFRQVRQVTLPRWPGSTDALGVYVRDATSDALGPHIARPRRRRWRLGTSR